MKITRNLVAFALVAGFAFSMISCGHKAAETQSEAPADSVAAPASEHPADSATHANEHPADSTK